MTSAGPTRGAAENEWSRAPWKARSLRFVAWLAPVVVAWLVVRVASHGFWSPGGWGGKAGWLLQAIVVAASASILVDRVARRLLPLAALFEVSLVFPDEAPSRFSTALRSGNVRKLVVDGSIPAGPLGDDAASTAERALELVTALSTHDRRTRGHTERVRAYADVIAAELELDHDERQKLAWGVLLHDIGKMTVPSAVLNKEAKLTDEEWLLLKGHPAAATEMLAPLEPWLGPWLKAAPEHHERWDGTGYPLGLRGGQISLAGRICAVADAYDVITSKRSYKAPMTAEAARAELVRCAGSQFDPDVVRAFLNAGLGKRFAGGPLAWLAEIPSLGQAGSVASTTAGGAAGTVSAGVAALTVAVGGTIGLIGTEPPALLAMEDLSEIVSADEVPMPASVQQGRDDDTSVASPVPSPDGAGTTLAPPGSAPPTSVSTTTPSTPTTRAPQGGGSTLPNGRTPSSTVPANRTPTTAAPSTTPTTTPTTTSTTAVPSTTTTSPGPVAPVTFSLMNSAAGDTPASDLLPLSLGPGRTDGLANFDTNRDDNPGLKLKKSKDGLDEDKIDRVQTWSITLTSEVELDGDATFTIWVADKDFHDHDHELGFSVRLTICDPQCTVVGVADWTEEAGGGGAFRPVTVGFGTVHADLGPGSRVQLELAVPDDLSERDVNFAFDAAAYPSALTIG